MTPKGSNSDGERSSSPTRRTLEAEDVLLPLAQIERLGFASHGGRSESQLFSSFVSLAYSLALEPEDSTVVDLLDRLRHKDLGVLNTHLITIGYGSSFVVSIMTAQDDIPGLDTIVLKRTIPSTAAQSGDRVRKRIESLMLELRVLTHGPIRKHENIVELLGVAWETDPLDLQRRWPVLIMERATKGTLEDFLQPSDPNPFRIKMALALDVVLGLKVLHQCGVLHGDIKTDNVLVFENQDPETRAERPVVAKLADFSGVLFDKKNPIALPSGTRPWNAPEWRQSLAPDSLLKTDLYSLGFLIFRIMVDGKHPFLDFSFPTDDSWSRVDILKEDDDKMQMHMKSLSGFSEDVDVRALHAILDCTLRSDPSLRNLDSVEKILQETSYQYRESPDLGDLKAHQVQLEDQSLPFSYFGIDSLDHGIAKHIAAELIRMTHDISHPERASEAAYGLAVLSINGVIGDGKWETRKEEGLKWLERAARSGSDRAQASFSRACRAFGAEVPADCVDLIQAWLQDTASKGFFVALEDLAEFGSREALKEAAETLRGRYGGTGAERYDEDHFPDDFPHAFDQRLSKQVQKVLRLEESRMNRFGDNILHFAVSCGLESTTKELIENHGRDALDTRNVRGETPLLLACRSGHYLTTMRLLEAGADPRIPSDYGDTPLHWLLSFDDKYVDEVARKLVQTGVKVDAVAERWQYIHCGENAFIAGTPLMRAVTRNRLKAVETLLKMGADPNFTIDGASAITMAAFLHYPDVLEVLISRSSDEPRTVERSTGKSLLIQVIMGGSLEANGSLFGRLRRHGHRWRSTARRTLQVLLGHGAGDHLHDVPGLSGRTALFLAATYAEPDVLEFLLENAGAEHINTLPTVPQDPQNSRSPLAAAIKSRNMEAFRLLLKHGADATTRESLAEPEDPVTLLYECAWAANDDPDFAQALIEHGVAVDESPDDYETPFGCALRNRCFALAECLLQNQADANKEYKSGLFFAREQAMTVLGHLVTECSVGTLACLNFLFRSRGFPCRPDFLVSRHLGLSVLHVVAITPFARQDERASGMILATLLTYFKPSQGQLDMAFSDNRYTALHIAVLYANYTVVRGLLNAGADTTIKDADGSTALDLAKNCVSSFPEITENSDFALSERTREKMQKRRDAVATLLADFLSPKIELPKNQGT